MSTPRQINLYNPAFRVPREWMTLPRLAMLAGLLVLGTLAASGWLNWKLSHRQDHISQLTTQREALQAKLQLARPVQAVREKRLTEELAGLQRQEQVLRRILEAAGGITAPAAGDRPPHSQLLEALARASHPGLWLTRVDIPADAGATRLQGRMLDAAALPRYIARLNQQEALSGLRFDQLEVKSAAADGAAPLLDFVLQSAPADTPGKVAP